MTTPADGWGPLAGQVATYPLLAALAGRRSRRFAKGASLTGGPLTFHSSAAPEPLTVDEEAALAFAAAGITGPTLAELPYAAGTNPESGCGNIIVHFAGRTIPSGDALHSVTLFMLNDEGTWMLRRPQDFAAKELIDVVAAGREGRLRDAYLTSRIRVSAERASVERKAPIVPPFNLWDSNLPGTSYFVPVTEFTSLYINVLLTAFSTELGYYILDDRAGYRPAGLKHFSRARGGHLCDDVRDGRVLTVSYLESALVAIAATEEGAMHQNLALMTEALGLGGFTHACRHPQWLKSLGFAATPTSLSRMTHMSLPSRLAMRIMGWPDPVFDIPVGLRRPGHLGDWLVRAFCPPHFPDMRSAVMAYVDYKFGEERGTLRASQHSAWKAEVDVHRQIPVYSQHAIDATVAYCEYLHDRYGRFPATIFPFETILAYQAHHLDVAFYDKFYRPEALGARQRAHHHA